MITQDWKISKLLDTYPQTLKVLIAANPKFKKLNNKILRKALAPRVSIEQAAEISGVDANALLAALNEAVGFGGQAVQSTNTEIERKKSVSEKKEKPAMLNKLSTEQETVLDVRPILESGTDPFKTIITTIKAMKPGQVLHLVNSFEPKPLYAVLAQRGFEHWTEFSDGTFNVYFYQEEKNTFGERAEQSASPLRTTSTEEKIIELDVRDLAPPEPMMKILETLPRVDDNTILLVHHHREPMMLYEKLEERGYEAITNKIEEHYYKVVIRKAKK